MDGLQQGEIISIGNVTTLAASLFKNMESFGGDVFYRPPTMSKNQEVRLARDKIVRQARDLERYSELVRGGLDRKTDMVVGPRLRVHPQPDFDLLGIDDPEARKKFIQQCKRWFNNWAYDDRKLCDGEGHYDFGGMMWMAYRNMEGPDGETGGVIHFDKARRKRYRTRWATYVTVVDPDRIESPPEYAGNDRVFEGKLLDRDGRMIGMWVRIRHPSEGGTDFNDYQFVPRETPWGRPMAWHHFVKTRGGQQRGITNLVTIIKRTGMLDAFDTSYVAAAAVNAELATYIRTKSSSAAVAESLAPAASDPAATWSMFENKVGYYGKAKFRIGRAGQRLAVLPPDDEIMMTAVNRAIGDPMPFRKSQIRDIASSVGTPFAMTAQDYSEANYSSERASKLDAWLGVTRQRVHFSASPPTLIYSAVIEEAIAEGWIEFDPSWPSFQENRAAYCACTWTGPGMGWIDPQKEANAYQTLLDIKVTSRQRIAAERGDDAMEIFDELAIEADEAEARGLDLTVAMPGLQTVDPANPDDSPGTPGEPPQGD